MNSNSASYRQFHRSFAALPINHPIIALTATALLTLMAGLGLDRLDVDSSLDLMMVSGDIERSALFRKKAVFGSDEIVSIAIQFEDALTPGSLSLQRKIANQIEQLSGVEDIDSLVTVDDISGRSDALVVAPLVPQLPDLLALSEAELDLVRRRIDSNPMWTGFLISADRRTVAFQVYLDDDLHADQETVVREIASVARDLAAPHPVFLAGHPYMKEQIAATMARDLGRLLPITVAVMWLALVVLLRSFKIALVLLATIGLSVLWMLGIMGWVGEPLTALTNAAPTILLALATAYFMHVASACNRASTVRDALDEVRRPVLVAGLTTAVGFGSLVLSKIPLVRGFGFYLASGLLGVLFLACISLPAALTLMRREARIYPSTNSLLFAKALFSFTRFSARWPSAILVASLAIIIAGALVGSRISVDSSGPGAFSNDSEFSIGSRFYRDHLGGDVVGNIYLMAGGLGGVKEPDLLRRIRDFQGDIEQLDEVQHSISISNYIGLMNRALHGDQPQADTIPPSRDAVAQYLLLYSLSGDLTQFDDLVDPGFSHTRVMYSAIVPSSSASRDLRKTLEARVRDTFPEESDVSAVLSTEILLSKAADALVREQVRTFSICLALILMVVGVSFRSVWGSVAMLVPNLVPLALNLILLFVLGLSLSHSTSLFAVIAIGIAVDSSVHVLAAARRSQASHGSIGGSMVHAIQIAGRPVAASGGIVVAGFSVLMLSDFRLVSELGGLTAFTMLCCLAADLIVLPAQVFLFERWHVVGFFRQPGVDHRAGMVEMGGLAFPAIQLAESNRKVRLEIVGERWAGGQYADATWRTLHGADWAGVVNSNDPVRGTVDIEICGDSAGRSTASL